MKLGIVNLGCPKNTVDTECMMSYLGGFILTNDPKDADVIVVNTCAFLKDARDESSEAIRDMISYQKYNPDLKVIVAGCYVSKDITDLKKQFPGIHALVGVNDIYNIKKAVEKGGIYNSSAPFVYKGTNHTVVLNPYSAYVKISEGCNHKCSFCTIPSIKGKYRSRKIPDIAEETASLVHSGIKEINLISQDLIYYGMDIYGKKKLDSLLKSIMKKIDKKFWLRLLYLYPDIEVIKRVVDVIKKESRILKYFDIPFQHVSDDILKSMRRGYRKKDIIAIIELIKTEIPEAEIRTSFITGYPGERKSHFNELLDFVQGGMVEKAGIFGYSDEPGTYAYGLKGKVAAKEIEMRKETLMVASAQVCHYNNKNKKGSKIPAIIVGQQSKDTFVGRTAFDAPDIDNYIFIKSKRNIKTGSVIKATVTGAVDTDLKGEY